MKEFLIKILKSAGHIQKENFNQVNLTTVKESISSVVTEIDFLCDQTIVGAIRREYPDHNILSEEGGFLNNRSKYTWIVDPLDGTSNYAAGIPWFGVLIALCENNLPILAGAYLPMDDILYVAEAGKGSCVNNRKLIIESKELKNSLFGFAMDFTDDKDFLENSLEMYKFLIKNSRNLRCTNSLIDLLLVAEGKLGGTINMCTKIWDIAAPYLIVKEAGGLFQLIGGAEIEFKINENAHEVNYPVILGSLNILAELKPLQDRIWHRNLQRNRH